MKRRKTVAFLTSGIMDLFSIQLANGIISAIDDRKDDVNLLIFPLKYINREWSEGLDPSEYQYQTSTVFLQKENVDVLLVAADCIACLTNEENKLRFMESLGDIPVVLVASRIDGYPGVSYDNTSGIEDGLNYLIEQRGVRKICMLGGAGSSTDALERRDVYERVMKAHGIPVYDHYYVETNLTYNCREEVAFLLDSNPDVEAIFCVNDSVAFGLYAEMKARGLVPGRDIYVLGFDNEADSAIINPSLTTVDADPVKLGQYAYQMAVRMMDGEKIGAETISTRLIIRDSFGGVVERQEQEKNYYLDKNKMDVFFDKLFYRYDEREEQKDNSRLRKAFHDMANMTIDYITAKADDKELNRPEFADEVIAYADEFFKSGALSYADVDEFVFFLEHFLQSISDSDADKCVKNRADELMMKMLKRIIKVMGNRSREISKKGDDTTIALKNLVRDSLNFAYGNDHSYSALISHVEWLDMKNAYIYVYDKPIVHLEGERVQIPRRLRLKAALTDGRLIEIPYSDQRTKVEDMFFNRKITKDPYKMILIPLFSWDTLYGAMMFDATEQTFKNGDFLTNQFGTAVHIIHILKQNNEIQKQLEDNLAVMSKNNIELDKLSRNDVLTGILNRRGFRALAESILADNRELKRDTLISYVDMNNLKVINDRFGHDEGDFALKAVSTVLSGIIGNRGIVGRIGGDEYAFVYYGESDVDELREAIRLRFEEYNTTTDKPYNVTISCGFCWIRKDDDQTLDDAMGMADQDLYVAKKTKDNRVLKEL